jgi:hypothetical protein
MIIGKVMKRKIQFNPPSCVFFSPLKDLPSLRHLHQVEGLTLSQTLALAKGLVLADGLSSEHVVARGLRGRVRGTLRTEKGP